MLKAAVCPAALRLAAHEQFAVEDARRREGGGDFGETAGDVVAGAAEQLGRSRDMDDLDADAVPFPLGRIVGEVELEVVERVREHERPEGGDVLRGRLRAAADPREQLGVGRRDAVPDLLDRLDFDPETLRERRLRQPRRDADAQRPRRELEQRIARLRVEPVHQFGHHPWGVGAREAVEAVDDLGERRRGARLGGERIGPEQRHRLGEIADIVVAHVEQHRIDAVLDQRADQLGLHRLQVEPAGQRGKRPAAIGVGGRLQIVADQPQLGVARPRVEQGVEERGEGLHRSL